jgi:hypothetical protein
MKNRGGGQKGGKKTYNTRDSLVVTDPTTSLAVAGLSMGERTGSRIFRRLWSYVTVWSVVGGYRGGCGLSKIRPMPHFSREWEVWVKLAVFSYVEVLPAEGNVVLTPVAPG